ncbi:protein FAM171B-like [Corythoichthys intestinalis]|uniref:protein FAM171B-like n=1 Tax=Corythoichthys intestinalis TaxID=161448 RepID=UPI0025A60EA1|nr:protein FAM171B-like [Corythoichthys intestinalis]
MLIWLCISVLILHESEALDELAPTGTGTRPSPLHFDDEGNFSTDREPPLRLLQVPELLPGLNFNLKVQVTDMLTRQHLNKTTVDLYVNYTRTKTVLTGEDGAVLLQVPFENGPPVTVVACRDGYICTVVPYKTIRTPIFSSVTIPLLGQTQGNIWLFEDTFLITDKTSVGSLKPIVQFPKSLLNLTEGSDITSFKAYLTLPKPPIEGRDFPKTLGIISSATGLISMELHPVAAISVRLFSGDRELHISGQVKISLTLPDNCGLQSSNAVPAWLYNQTTGGWVRQGLGTVVSESGKLSWTFTAPHLGYWIAAPMPTTGDVFRGDVLSDFLEQYPSFLMVAVGGLFCIFACLLVGILCCHRTSVRQTKVTRLLPLMKKDQFTMTGSNEDIEGSTQSQHGLKQFTEKRDEQHNVNVAIYNGNIIANPNALPGIAEPSDLDPSTNTTELIRLPACLTESLVFYNQPLAIMHASAFFQGEDQQEQPHWSKSMALYTGDTENLSEEKCSQNASQALNQVGDSESKVSNLENAQVPTTRGQYGLLESASVPETLSKMKVSRHSMDAVTELSKIPSSQPPRAWFVSLEGKPAAEIHYAVAEQQRRRRTAESQETSLDSGVDMIEMNQTPSRRAVTLERNATFIKRTSSGKHISQ